MHRRVAVAAAAAALLLTAGCTVGGAEGDEVRGNNAPSATPSESILDDEEPLEPSESEATSNDILAFGKTYTYTDGLSVTVSPAKKTTVSDGYEKEYPNPYSFTVRVVNESKEKYDPSDFSSSLQSGNTEAEEIYDSEQGFGGSPGTAVLPGREAEWKIAYSVSNPKDLVLEVNVDWVDRAPVYYTSAL